METTLREPHAPLAALPELDEFLRPFHPHFGRSEGRESLERYLTGLLTEHPNKNCDTLAQVLPGTSQQRLHNLLTDLAWDHDDLNDQRVRIMLRLPSEGDAVLIFDDTGFPKQGQSSVGVQRQYSGTLGKTRPAHRRRCHLCQSSPPPHNLLSPTLSPPGRPVHRWSENRSSPI
jgi:SRSO17 transposase